MTFDPRHGVTHMVPDVVGTMGMSSASVGMDQGMWNWGAISRITMFLNKHTQAHRHVSKTGPLLLCGRGSSVVEPAYTGRRWGGGGDRRGMVEHKQLLPQDLGTVVIVLHGLLHEAEAVHVAHVRVAVGPEEIKPAHSLLPWEGGRKKKSVRE